MANFSRFFPEEVPAASGGQAYREGDIVVFNDNFYGATGDATLSDPVVAADFNTNWALLSGGGGGSVILPAPDIIDHVMNPVLATNTSFTLHPTIRDIGNYQNLELSAFYIEGMNDDPADIIANGMQSATQMISMPMAGVTPTISITGLTRNTTYSIVIAIAIPGDGGYYVSEIEQRATAVNTDPSVTIAITTGDATPNVGDEVVFTATAVDNEGDAVLLQWQRAADGTTFTDISGETGATYTISSYVIDDHDGTYRVRVTSPTTVAITSNTIAVAGSTAPPPGPQAGVFSGASATGLYTTNHRGGGSVDRRFPAPYSLGSLSSGNAVGWQTIGAAISSPAAGNAGWVVVPELPANAAGATTLQNSLRSGRSFGFNDSNITFPNIAAGLYQIQATTPLGTAATWIEAGNSGRSHTTPVTFTYSGAFAPFSLSTSAVNYNVPSGTTQFQLGPAPAGALAEFCVLLAGGAPTTGITLTVTGTDASNITWSAGRHPAFGIDAFCIQGIPSVIGTGRITINANA